MCECLNLSKKCSIVYLCKQRAMPKIGGTIKLVCKCKNYTCKSKSRCFFRRFVSPHRSRLIFGLSVFVTPLPRNSQILSRWERKPRVLPLRSPPPPSPRPRRGRSPLAQRKVLSSPLYPKLQISPTPFRVAKFSPPYNFLSIRLVKKLICDL